MQDVQGAWRFLENSELVVPLRGRLSWCRLRTILDSLEIGRARDFAYVCVTPGDYSRTIIRSPRCESRRRESCCRASARVADHFRPGPEIASPVCRSDDRPHQEQRPGRLPQTDPAVVSLRRSASEPCTKRKPLRPLSRRAKRPRRLHLVWLQGRFEALDPPFYRCQ